MAQPRRNSRINDKRGNSKDRAARKIWMLATFEPLSDPNKAHCVHCKSLVGYDDVQADRIEPGGSYARHNVQPSCAPCNLARSNNTDWVYVP